MEVQLLKKVGDDIRLIVITIDSIEDVRCCLY